MQTSCETNRKFKKKTSRYLPPGINGKFGQRLQIQYSIFLPGSHHRFYCMCVGLQGLPVHALSHTATTHIKHFEPPEKNNLPNML